MTEVAELHKVDVGIRALIMEAARARLNVLREQERAEVGAPQTSLSDVGRAILAKWKPVHTAPRLVNGRPQDRDGNPISQRGHRKFVTDDRPAIPEREAGQSAATRAAQFVEAVELAVADGGHLALPRLNELERKAREEGLIMNRVGERTVGKHIAAGRRAVLKPFRFTMPEAAYQDIYERLTAADTTVTRALEVGLERFAETGKY